MIRIVAGRFKGRKLAVPEGGTTRPTSDRVRESLFNILTHGHLENGVTDLRVLDAFAGTGALGLEALSRGAAYALFMELEPEARGLIRQNIEALALTGHTKIFRRDATQPGFAGTLAPFDLVFLDPPYGKGLGERALAGLRDGGWLSTSAIVVWEETVDATVSVPAEFDQLDERTYGDTRLTILEHLG